MSIKVIIISYNHQEPLASSQSPASVVSVKNSYWWDGFCCIYGSALH